MSAISAPIIAFSASSRTEPLGEPSVVVKPAKSTLVVVGSMPPLRLPSTRLTNSGILLTAPCLPVAIPDSILESGNISFISSVGVLGPCF